MPAANLYSVSFSNSVLFIAESLFNISLLFSSRSSLLSFVRFFCFLFLFLVVSCGTLIIGNFAARRILSLLVHGSLTHDLVLLFDDGLHCLPLHESRFPILNIYLLLLFLLLSFYLLLLFLFLILFFDPLFMLLVFSGLLL